MKTNIKKVQSKQLYRVGGLTGCVREERVQGSKKHES